MFKKKAVSTDRTISANNFELQFSTFIESEFVYFKNTTAFFFFIHFSTSGSGSESEFALCYY